MNHFSTKEQHGTWNTRYAGKRINHIHVRINGIQYKTSRVVWKLIHREDAKFYVSHINGDVLDFRAENLADHRGILSQSESKSRGTALLKNGKWRAAIYVDGAIVNLGVYNTMEAAHTAFINAENNIKSS